MKVSDFLVLTVGDEPDQLAEMQQAFSRANLVNPLRHVPSGEAAIDYLSGTGPYSERREHPRPSLILLNLRLPGMDGLEVVERLRAQRALQAISVALVCDAITARERERADDLGVTAYLGKPVDPEGLLQMMASIGMYWLILRKKPEPAEVEAAPAAAPERAPRRRALRSQDTDILGDEVRFQKTSWTLVKAASHAKGMDELIRLYWKPLYYFIRQKGFDNETAKDVVQDFLAHVLERGTIARADPARGKFRTFLLTALCNFIRDWHKASNRLKRGGGQSTLSFDFDASERQYAFEVASGETPETILNRAWLQSVLEECILELTGNSTHLHAFRMMTQGQPYSTIAKETGLSESAVKAAVFRLRQQLRELVLRRIQPPKSESDSDEFDVSALTSLLG